MKLLFTLLISIILLANHPLSVSKDSVPTTLEEINANLSNAEVQILSTKAENEWIEFKKNSTKKAFRAYGQPISIEGYSSVNQDNIQDLSMNFIEQNETLLGVNKNQIKYHSSNYVNGKWYVHLKQKINGLVVAFSGIELRINKYAQVFAYGVEYFETNEVDLSSKISYQQAIASEIPSNSQKSYTLDVPKSGNKFAFPIYENGKYRIESAYRVEYIFNNSGYSAYISSVSGKTLFRRNENHNLKTEINLHTNIKEVTTQSPITKVPVENINIKVDGKTYVTDKDGKVEIDLEEPTQVKIDFEGPWVKFENNLFKQGQINAIIVPGDNNQLEWDDSNSEIRERMVVHHLNKIRNYFKSFDENVKAMDFQLKLVFEDDNNDANAYSNGEEIHFIGMKDKSANLAGTPTVLYHEYGHSINALLYMELGQEAGMINRAAHEGIADITACFLVDDSRLGLGAYPNPNKPLRDCNNNFIYPDDMLGEVHHDGQILAGAMWDMKLLIGLERARELAHFARYGLPDDSDNGVCFSEWLVEILIADDDDGNLTNGTPNDVAIISAFEKHNIGFDILSQNSLVHSQNSDVIVNDDIIIMGTNNVDYNFKKDSLELTLVYSFDNFKTSDEIEFSGIDEATKFYKYAVNKEQNYGVISYYFNLKNVSTGKLTERIKTDNGKNFFKVDYGYAEKHREEMIVDDWSFTSQTQLGAHLEVAKADEIDYGAIFGRPLKQSKGADDNNDLCIVTGSKMPETEIFFSMPYGQSEAISPRIDISSFDDPVLKFESWYSKVLLVQNSDIDLHIDVSSNGGNEWVRVFSTEEGVSTLNSWETNFVTLSNHIELTENFRYRVVVIPTPGFNISSGYPSTLSEFQVDNISVIDPISTSNVEDKARNGYNVFVTNDNITISNINNTTSLISIELFDLSGRIVNSLEEYIDSGKGSEIRIERKNIRPGIYFLKINDNQNIITRKLLIYE